MNEENQAANAATSVVSAEVVNGPELAGELLEKWPWIRDELEDWGDRKGNPDVEVDNDYGWTDEVDPEPRVTKKGAILQWIVIVDGRKYTLRLTLAPR